MLTNCRLWRARFYTGMLTYTNTVSELYSVGWRVGTYSRVVVMRDGAAAAGVLAHRSLVTFTPHLLRGLQITVSGSILQWEEVHKHSQVPIRFLEGLSVV